MRNFGLMTMLAFVIAPAMAGADGWTVFDGGWRISAGAVYDSGVKTDMKFTPRQTYRSPYSTSPGALTREQAQRAGQGTTTGTRTTYTNARTGESAWIDRNDPATGHDAGLTENYMFPRGLWNGSSFELGYAEWEELEARQESFGSMESFASDEGAMPGINVELSRNLYHDETWGWGVDLAFAFQYSRRNKAVRMGGGRPWAIGSSRKTSGGYSSRYSGGADYADMLNLTGVTGEDREFLNEVVWHGDDGYVGTAGDPLDSAEPIDANDIGDNSSSWENGALSHSEYGSLDAEGDYEDLELMLLARPYYDVFDWLRINAMLGLVVSRQEMEMSFTMFRNGSTDYRSNRDFSQWDVYGVAGLGLMLYWNDFVLSGDFMARFLDNEMEIEDSCYRGTVRRGRWMFRLSAGYEF